MRLDLISQRLLDGAGAHGPVALVYHSVQPGTLSTWSISLAALEAQLDLLHDLGWRTLRVCDLRPGDATPARTVVLTFDDGYADNLAAADALQDRGMLATWFVVSGHVGRKADWTGSEAPGAAMLDAAGLRSLAARGFEVGSHTRTHSRLTAAAAELDGELRGSREDLEQLLGIEVTSFAYPYGDWNDPVVAAVRSAGFRAACTTDSGWALRGRDLLRIRRITVFGSDDLGTFARKLAFADNDAGWARVAAYAAKRALGRTSGR